MTIGRNTEKGRDLEQRASRIIGLKKVHKDLKRQAKDVKEQIDAAFKDAAGNGYNKPVLRQVIRELMLDADDRQAVFQFESEIGVYRHALGIEDDGTASPRSFAARVESGAPLDEPSGRNVLPFERAEERVLETEAAE